MFPNIGAYTNPVCWKVYDLKRSKKTGKYHEVVVGWYGRLEHALNRAMEYVVADSDAQSVAEVLKAIQDFKESVRETRP